MLADVELVKMLDAVERLKRKGLLTEEEYRAHVDPFVLEHGMDSMKLANHIALLVQEKTPAGEVAA